MKTVDHHGFSRVDAAVRMCENVLIIASPHFADTIDWASDREELPGLIVAACDNSAPVPFDAVAGASLVVIEIDLHSGSSLDRLTSLKRRFPNLPVIAAIADASLPLVRTLIREGVADVVSLPFRFEELLETAVAVLGQQSRSAKPDVRLAPMFAVARSIGGCGATSIATHLAADLGRLTSGNRGVAIVDLDLQFGSVADFMSGTGRGSIADLLSAEGRLDDDLIRSVARQAAENVAVFAAPDGILPLESVDTDRLLGVLDMLRRHYACVILDLPANWTNWTLSAVSAADLVLMVVELSVASLRQAKRRLDLFASVGIEAENIAVVVNRVQRRLFRTIDVDDVAQTLGHVVLGSVSLEEPLVGTAQDQGMLVHQLQRKSRFHADICKIAEQLSSRWLQSPAR